MDKGWKIVFYENKSGDSPVYNFVERLNIKTKSKVAYVFNLLESQGISVKEPHVKKLVGTGLWELRVLGDDNLRIFYAAITGRKFILLHGFLKKKQKTDRKQIEIASQRLFEYKAKNS